MTAILVVSGAGAGCGADTQVDTVVVACVGASTYTQALVTRAEQTSGELADAADLYANLEEVQARLATTVARSADSAPPTVLNRGLAT